MNPAETEEEALNLLFLGDTNRAIAETPMNMASSRSHCIFTLSLEIRQVNWHHHTMMIDVLLLKNKYTLPYNYQPHIT
jgi:hypothetical protein